MQSTGPPANPPQSDLLKTMQPQSQQIFIPSSGSNGTANIRPSQQSNTIYRGPPTNAAPRGGARHVSMPPMYQQPMHQGVVMPAFPTFASRQPAYQNQYPYSQTLPFYPSYQFFPSIQQPQAHQRGPVAVNTGVNVGNSLSVQPSPNGPPGASQAQMSLGPGAVLSVPPCSSTVLGVASTGPGQQQVGVGMPSLVGVGVPVPGTAPTQTTQNKVRRRKHALDIINPDTNRNIFENIEPISNASEVDNHEQTSSVPVIPTEVQSVVTQQQDLSTGIAPLVLPAESRTIVYNMDMHQMQHQRDIAGGQTPVVSAMSDAPSVEIRPTLLKPRAKKIIPITAPKDEPSKVNSAKATVEDSKQLHKQQEIKKSEEPSTKSVVVEQIPQVSQVRPETPKKDSSQIPHTTEVRDQVEVQHLDTTATINTVTETHASNDSICISESDQTADSQTSTNTCSAVLATVVDQQEIDSCNNSGDVVVSTNIDTEDSNPTVTDELKEPQIDDAVELIQNPMKNMKINEKELPVKTREKTQTSQTKPTFIEKSVVASNGESSSNKNYAKTSKSEDVNKNVVAEDESLNKSEENAAVDNVAIIKNSHVSDSVPDSPARDETDRSTIESESEIAVNKNEEQAEEILPSSCKQTEAISDTLSNSVASKPPSADTKAPKTLPHLPKNATSASAASVVPLINYNEGQWSPQNPTGKKQYDREQLLQLREAQASRVQPKVNNVAILPQPNLMPSFARGNNTKRVQSMVGSIGANRGGGDSSNYINKQSSMSGVNSRDIIRVNLSLNQDVKLNETDNAWRPRVLNSKESESNSTAQADREKVELIRRVRGILNKLTPEKFDALVEEIIKLKIDTTDKMEAVMVLVFEKAIDEPNFSVSYARLCRRLVDEAKARDERMENGTENNLAHFRIALLDKTEREFTQNVSKCTAKEAKLQPILDKIKNCTDPDEKIELQALLEEEERKIRRRSGGTVRFIGELFKISMLTVKIIKHCIETLLEPKNEDMLECLCKLLTTVGAKYEQVIPKDHDRPYSLEPVISRMQAIASKKDSVTVSSRVRFMLQDVIDLRKNKWQSSRNEAPKTMEQIEKEAKNEQLSSQYLNYSGMLSGGGGGSGSGNQNSIKRDDRGSSRYDSRSSGGGYGGSQSQRGDTGSLRRQQQSGSGGAGNSGNNNFGANNDDNTWQVQTSKGGRSSLAVDTNKLEGLQNLDMGSKKMGGVSQFLWTQQRQSAPVTPPSNSFAVLSTLIDSNKSSSSDRDRDRGGSRNKGSYNKNSIERDRYNDRGVHSRTGSSQGSRENSSSRGHQGGRSVMNASSMQKSASHKNYTQPMTPRLSGKSAGLSSISASANALHPHHRGEQQNQLQQSTVSDSSNASAFPTAPPPAVFEEPNRAELNLMKSIAFEIVETSASSKKALTTAIVPVINRLAERQRCGFLYYILSEFLHLSEVNQLYRRYISNATHFMITNKFIAVEHFRLAYEQFCKISGDLIYDVPELWLYIFEYAVPLIQKQVLTVRDLKLKEQQENEPPNFCQKFLKSLLICCTREVGPSFARSVWKSSNMTWTDFMPESEVQAFIESNKFGYIENENLLPNIVVKENAEKHVAKVVERVEHLLNEGCDQNAVIDYINGNMIDVDKKFISSLTTAVCNFAINFKDDTYKLDSECFQKVCIPILQRYIDLKPERELECLYALQFLVHSLEHPRALLSELFEELYFNDVITQESFTKWRGSKDQTAGKGVAVKGLGPFFNHLLRDDTSEENN